MKQPSAPFLHLLTCTQAIKAIKAIKMANDPWDHSPFFKLHIMMLCLAFHNI